MPTIMPHSELLRRAVVWISETRAENPGRSTAAIIDEASMRFNLSPLDSDALSRLFSDEGKADGKTDDGETGGGEKDK